MGEPTPSAIHQRWRGAVTSAETGFTAVPDVLIRSQGQLKLSSTEMMVLLNILLHWWREGEWPYPRVSAISERMGISRRTVERAIRRLQEKGLVVHRRSEVMGNGPAARRFDLSGLIDILRSRAEVWRVAKTSRAPAEDHREDV